MGEDYAVVLSVRPEYASKIASGIKTVELRKTNLKIIPKVAVIYSTLPVGRVVAVIAVKNVVRAKPHSIWRSYSKLCGIKKVDFDLYFSGKDQATAIIMSSERHECDLQFSALGLGERPPQSFIYARLSDLPINLPQA